MTKTCLRYLSSDIFDVGIEPEMIKSNTLSGIYRLHWFATTQWIVLLQECEKLLGNSDLPESLLLALKHFVHECENGNFEATVGLNSQSDHEFSTLSQKEPSLHKLLVQELHFRRMDVGDWKLEDNDEGIFNSMISAFEKQRVKLTIHAPDDDSWTNMDPFYLSFTSVLIHETFESLLCQKGAHTPSCSCTGLKKVYGGRIFRCHYAICQPLQVAFVTRADRDAHCRYHSRVFKCPHPSCDFSELGFPSASRLQKHKSMCHLNAPLKAIQMIQDPEQDEIVPLISIIIQTGMTAELQPLLSRFRLLRRELQEALVKESAFCGKLQIFQLLFEQCSLQDSGFYKSSLLSRCAEESIRGENHEVLESIEKSTLGRELDYMKLGANSESSRIFDTWKKQVVGVNSKSLLSGHLFRSLRDPAKQERYAGLLDEEASRGIFLRPELSVALKEIASTTCASSIARVLLRYGADVEYRAKNKKGQNSMTPLLLAARKNTKEGAELMKLLLLAGADPNASYRIRKDGEPQFASMGIGAQNISKWLPFNNWSELVAWAAAERSNNRGLTVLPTPLITDPSLDSWYRSMVF